MSKNRLNYGKAMNIAIVNEATLNKKRIRATDTYNSNTYKNQEISSDYGWINELPSSIKREYGKMGKTEKAVFWLTGFALLGVAGYASSDTVKKTVDNNAKVIYEKLFSKTGGKTPIAAPVVPVINKSVKPTITPQPTATPLPNYDYYDKDFKVGIVIEGDQQFKQNVTSLLETFKQVTPDDYNDLIKYAPKNIVRSKDAYNWYSLGSDTIQLPESSEKLGGSKDLKTRLLGVLQLVPEFGNAKQYKTGVTFNSVYDSELDANVRKAKYAVKIGLWTQAYADNYIKSISGQLNNGTYFDGAKLNQS